MLGIKHDKLHSNEVFSSKYFDTKYFTSELQEIYRTDDLFFQAKQVCRVCGKQIAKPTKHDATACLNHREQMNRKLKK